MDVSIQWMGWRTHKWDKIMAVTAESALVVAAQLWHVCHIEPESLQYVQLEQQLGSYPTFVACHKAVLAVLIHFLVKLCVSYCHIVYYFVSHGCYMNASSSRDGDYEICCCVTARHCRQCDFLSFWWVVLATCQNFDFGLVVQGSNGLPKQRPWLWVVGGGQDSQVPNQSLANLAGARVCI